MSNEQEHDFHYSFDNQSSNPDKSAETVSEEGSKPKRNIYGKVIRWSWILFLTGFFSFILCIFFIRINLFGWFGQIPDFEILENPKSELATEIYSNDGKMIGKYFNTNRTNVTFDEISPWVIKALIATEDERFVQHSGVDMRATLRIVTKLGSSGGGSTISQQLAKNLFKMRVAEKYRCKVGGPFRMLAIKTKEWTTASRLEKSYSKKEIITMYLNTVQFGGNAWGIFSASKKYFDKHPKDLNIQEAAVLVGKLKAISAYDPVINPDRALSRRNTVFYQMSRFGDEKGPFITIAQKDSLQSLPIELNLNNESAATGIAPYFRAELKKKLKNIDALKSYDLKSDGLRIYTTINYALQEHAEKAVFNHMKWLQKQFEKDWRGKNPWSSSFIKKEYKRSWYYRNFTEKYGKNSDSVEFMMNKRREVTIFTYNGPKKKNFSPKEEIAYYLKQLRVGFVSLDPRNGYVKAWVGGVNHRFFSYDHVSQGSRQVGSTFKPIVYATAIKNGWSMCQEMLDSKVTINVNGKPWSPKAEKPTGEMKTLGWGLAQSRNHFAAKLIQKVGVDNVIELAERMGINSKLDRTPTLALGVSNINLLELTAAYCTFVNKGIYNPPVLITKIEDKSGKVIYRSEDDENLKSETVMSPKDAYIMVTMLRLGTETGTSRRLKYNYKLLDGGNQIGGKTGTTQNSADGLFVGISKNLVSGTWVGAESPQIHFRTGRIGQGARMALPIFGDYMKAAYKDANTGIKKGVFVTPETIEIEDILCDKEKIARLKGEDNSSPIIPNDDDDE